MALAMPGTSSRVAGLVSIVRSIRASSSNRAPPATDPWTATAVGGKNRARRRSSAQTDGELALVDGLTDRLRSGIDGVFLCVDIASSSNVEENLEHPIGTMIYSVSTFQKANEMFREAGFTSVESKHIPEDIFNVYYVCRKD